MLKVAVVGCGYWGPNLVRNFSATPGVEVAYACDTDPARVASIAQRFRVTKTTTRYEDVLGDPAVDAVVLATPVATHRRLGVAALEAGKHVWIEKPLAGSVADAEALVQAARKNDRRLFTDHTFIYTPAVQKIRDLIATGHLGDVLYFDSVRINLGLFQSDTNVLWDLGPHDISIAQHLFGKSPKSVSAIGVKHVEGATENMAYVILRYEGSLIAHFHFNWLAPVKVRQTIIGGSKKMIVYNDLDPDEKIRIYDKGVDLNSVEAKNQALVSYRSGDMSSPRIATSEALALGAREFAAAIAEKRAPITDGEAGLDVVRILAAAQRSIELQGQSIDL